MRCSRKIKIVTHKLKDKQFATTLARGVELLQCFGSGDGSMGNGDLVALTGLDKATVARLTFTLARLGYLHHDRTRRKYRLGPATLTLSYSLLASMTVRQLARPFMRQLALEVGGMVGIGLRQGADMLYVDAMRGIDGPPPVIDRGMAIPLLTSAMGNAWLASATPTERAEAVNVLRVKYPSTYATDGHRIESALREFRSRGYCSSEGHLRKNRLSVAVPLHRISVGAEIVVFNCAVLSDVDSKEQRVQLHRSLGEKLLEMLGAIERAAGISRL